jgi:hypothetical protein
MINTLDAIKIVTEAPSPKHQFPSSLRRLHKRWFLQRSFGFGKTRLEVTFVRHKRACREPWSQARRQLSQSLFDRPPVGEASTSHPGRQGSSLTLEQQATE